MDQAISATDATPIIGKDRAADGARSALLARLKRERAVKVGRWTRDELYDDAR